LIDVDPSRPQGKQIVWIRGVNTRKMRDESPFEFGGALLATETTRYETALGGSRQVVVLESIDLGPYYAKLKELGELAQDVKPDKGEKPSATDAKPAAKPKSDDDAATLKLAVAKQLLKDDREKGRAKLQDIIDRFPKTKAAAEAKKLLGK
jgi:hypothetical protein